MPKMIVTLQENERQIPFVPGRSVYEILNETDLRVRSGCRGIGACGLCRIRIEKGKVNGPTESERIYINNDQLNKGIRLACQVWPKDDLKIEIIAPVPESNWRNLPVGKAELSSFSLNESFQGTKFPYGIALDLGTTNISLSLRNLATGQALTGRIGKNPQLAFGSDVMTRLAIVSEDKQRANRLSEQVVAAISEALWDIATRDGINLQCIRKMTLVGNTAMLALLTKENYSMLLEPVHWVDLIPCFPKDIKEWRTIWGLHPQASIEIIQPLAGFIGSDLLAGILVTRLLENEGGTLFIDFGTNSEIALWDGLTLRVVSAAGGPAFEGCGIQCGMPAESGAIYRIFHKQGLWNFEVITGNEPCGICGSGMVDLISTLLGLGELTKIGQFVHPLPQEGFIIVKEKKIVLTKKDVDIFQRAKAAIGAGIKVLLSEANLGYKDLRKVYVSGAFGKYLNIENAQEIGLLPEIDANLIELLGNTALSGCENVLLSSNAAKQLDNIRERAQIINLSQHPYFEDLFIENLYLQNLR